MIELILILGFTAVLTLIVYSEIYPSIFESMTLKTDCDVRDRDCSVACRTADGRFVKRCFIECQHNSPIC